MLIDLQLEISAPDDWSVSISEPAALGLAYRFCIDEQIAQFAKLSGDIVAGHATISRLDLSFPAPEYRQLYENYCSGVIRFNAKRTRISLCCPRLDQPLRGFDREHNEICVRQCKFLVRQILSQTPLQSRINSVLMQSRGSMPTLESTARQLNISPRTLCRRLQEEGSGYQQLVGEFRKKLAKAYLLSSSLAPKEIADLLGFEDVNSFRRAFKSWTGQTIMEYLKAQPQSAEDTSELTPGMSVAGVNPASSMDRFACPEVLSAH